MQLAQLESIYPNVKNYHLLVEQERAKPTAKYLYTIKEGTSNVRLGLALAELAGLPKEAITAAKEIHVKLQASDSASTNPSVERQRTVQQLAQRLLNLRTSTLAPGYYLMTVID